MPNFFNLNAIKSPPSQHLKSKYQETSFCEVNLEFDQCGHSLKHLKLALGKKQIKIFWPLCLGPIFGNFLTFFRANFQVTLGLKSLTRYERLDSKATKIDIFDEETLVLEDKPSTFNLLTLQKRSLNLFLEGGKS